MLNTAGDQRVAVKISGQEWSPTPDATPITVFATTHGGGSAVSGKGLQLFASNFWPEKGATSDVRFPNTTTVTVTVANLPAHIKTAQLYRIDDTVTNPYPVYVSVRARVCEVSYIVFYPSEFYGGNTHTHRWYV